MLVNGFAGYSLPDDLLSAPACGSPTRSCSRSRSSARSSRLFFDGEFPGTAIISRLYIIHVLLLPGADRRVARRAPRDPLAPEAHPVPRARASRAQRRRLAAVADVRGEVDRAVRARRRRALRARRARADQPDLALRALPTGAVSTAAQPDWYLGWTEGALRLFPPWYLHLGHTIPEVFWPAVVLPGITFALLYVWPFLEAGFTHDDRTTTCSTGHATGRCAPRSARCLTFYVVLLVAGSQDIIAQHLGVDVTTVDRTFRVLLFIVPVAVALAAWKWCHDLAAASALAAEGGSVPPESDTACPDTPGAGPPAAADQDGHSGRSSLGNRIVTAILAALIATIGWVLERGHRPSHDPKR